MNRIFVGSFTRVSPDRLQLDRTGFENIRKVSAWAAVGFRCRPQSGGPVDDGQLIPHSVSRHLWPHHKSNRTPPNVLLAPPAPPPQKRHNSSSIPFPPPPTAAVAMPGIQGTTSPGHFLSFDDDDDGGFGDFKVASVNHPFPSRQQQDDDDDDWGDFMVSPMGSNAPVGSPFPPPGIFDAFPSDPAPADKIPSKEANPWEKPSGALPLSIFGEEEADEAQTLEPPVIFSSPFSSSDPAKDRKGVVAAGELKDLITSLYGLAPLPEGGQKTGSSLGEAKEEDSDESSWEFKEASSSPNSTLKVMVLLIIGWIAEV